MQVTGSSQTTKNNDKDRISIQVGLSGYSFKVYTGGDVKSSEWMNAERIFSTPELQKRYDEVEISVFTHKCGLVPEQFHSPDVSREMLMETSVIGEDDVVDYVSVPQFAAVLLYSLSLGGTLSRVVTETVLRTDGTRARPLPEMYYLLESLAEIKDYNKIVASYMDDHLYIAVAQGKSLLLCNSFHSPDFTTAEYFIFLVMKKLQLNPEMSSIYFRTPLEEDQELSLYRYFRSVERI